MATEEELKAADKFLVARRKFKSKWKIEDKVVTVDIVDVNEYNEAVKEFLNPIKKE